MVSRYPLIDVPSWKRDLVSALLGDGVEVSILYSRSGLVDHGQFLLNELADRSAPRRVSNGSAPTAGAARGSQLSGENVRGGAKLGALLRRLPLASWAKRQGIEIKRFETLRDPSAVAGLSALRPDVVVLAGADLVPASMLSVPTLATINPHYGLLPSYRGMNVTEWSVYHDDPVGVTVHKVDAGVDTGDIVLRERVEVEPIETLRTLRAKHQRLAQRMLREAVHLIAANESTPIPQAAGEGRQFYRMHPRLRALVESKLKDGTYYRRLQSERGSSG